MEAIMMFEKEIISTLFEKKVLVTKKIKQWLDVQTDEQRKEILDKIKISSLPEIKLFLSETILNNEIKEEKNTEKEKGNVDIFINYNNKEVKKGVGDFISYFTSRYKTLEKILRNRQELQGVTSIKRVLQKDEKESSAIIGLVKAKEETKNNNLILTVEDLTGEIKVIVTKEKKEVFTVAKNCVLDEIVGVVGSGAKAVLFAEKIILPDIPVYNELKKAPKEEYALFLSDIHVGSKQFLAENFEKFLRWLHKEVGDERQQQLVDKVKYIFIVGDIVDGVGIYPGQENDLEILDIFEQYKVCASLLKKIPQHIQIIISPGNHDAMRLAEPQLPIYEDVAKPLYELPNVVMVSNPAWVTVGKQEGFPGITVLLYHGYSFDYYIAEVDEIRNNGGYDRADLVMKFLLQRRHLAPTHASCLYIPFSDYDPMIISKIPDIFATGHLHKTAVSSYRNITLLCGSCWQGKTAFQEKMGHNPEPCRVPVVNLQTREVKILRFGE